MSLITPPQYAADICVINRIKTVASMKILFFLILLSLLVAVGFLLAFLWANRTGQFDDDFTPSVRMLFDNKTKDNAG
jgi:cbb3-type cytochrome oxidase maturation protein